MNEHQFEFEGKTYQVPSIAAIYTSDLVVGLPSGKKIKCAYWLESNPPIPKDWEIVDEKADVMAEEV